MKIEKFITGPLEVNTYILFDEDTQVAVVIDPGGNFEVLSDYIETKNLALKAILLTHGHFDHLGATNYLVKKYSCDLYLHDADYNIYKTACEHAQMCGTSIDSPPSSPLFFNMEIGSFSIGRYELEIIHTPGHSPGSVSFYNKELNAIFTGNLIFNSSVGRTDFPGSSYEELENSILSKIYTKGDSCLIYPGHGDKTIVGREKISNPFVKAL